MSRDAILNTQPVVPKSWSAERKGEILPWSWPASARVLLAVLALGAGLGLWRASRNVPAAPPTELVPDLVLDVNTAPEPVLAALPQVGPTLVRRLVEARNERPFTSLDDLGDRVRGVGPVTLARLAPNLRFEVVPGLQPEPPALKPKASRRRTTRAPRLTVMTTATSPPSAITSPAR
jgi:competence protein ComEA